MGSAIRHRNPLKRLNSERTLSLLLNTIFYFALDFIYVIIFRECATQIISWSLYSKHCPKLTAKIRNCVRVRNSRFFVCWLLSFVADFSQSILCCCCGSNLNDISRNPSTQFQRISIRQHVQHWSGTCCHCQLLDGIVVGLSYHQMLIVR